MIHVLRVEPVGAPETAPLTGVVAERIRRFAATHDPFHAADKLVPALMARLWSGDDSLCLLALVSGEGAVVGHVLALETDNGFTLVAQTQADQNVDDAVVRAEALVAEWATGRGRTALWMQSHRNREVWERKGWTYTHGIFQKRLDGQPVRPAKPKPVPAEAAA